MGRSRLEDERENEKREEEFVLWGFEHFLLALALCNLPSLSCPLTHSKSLVFRWWLSDCRPLELRGQSTPHKISGRPIVVQSLPPPTQRPTPPLRVQSDWVQDFRIYLFRGSAHFQTWDKSYMSCRTKCLKLERSRRSSKQLRRRQSQHSPHTSEFFGPVRV